MKFSPDFSLKLFIWLLALILVAALNHRNLVQLLALLAALTCLLSPSLWETFIESIRHHIKTFQGRFIGLVILCFLPSIAFSAWPAAGVMELVLFILTLLLLTGLAGIIPLMEDGHRRLFLTIMVWGMIISLLVFSLLHHPFYKTLPAQEGYWGDLQKFYNSKHRLWFTKSKARYLALFFPILLFALWHRRPRRPFVIFLFSFLVILFLYYAKSRTAIAGLFVYIGIFGIGVFFLPSISGKQKRYCLLLFLLAMMIPTPIVIGTAIKKQKEYIMRTITVEQATERKATPLGLPVWVIDIQRQIIWFEYIRGWSEKPFLGYGIDSRRHQKKIHLRINHRLDILIQKFKKTNQIRESRRIPHLEGKARRSYYHHNYIYQRLMQKGLISPHNLKFRIVKKWERKKKARLIAPFRQYHPHNYYVQILFETGLIGFIPFMAFLIFLFSRSALIFWRSREMGALFILGLHASFFTQGFFASHFFLPINLIIYGTVWIVILILTRQPDRIEQARPV